MNPHTYRPFDSVLTARLAHEAECEYQRLSGLETAAPWADLAPEQKAAIVRRVEGVKACVDLAQLHNDWKRHQAADGWKHGETFDADARLDPRLVPYQELPEDERRRDAIFEAVVKAALGL